nr:hypothetical protein Iba_chr08bCG9080 [Ipomoea batatas]
MAALAVTFGAVIERGVVLSCHICLAVVSGGAVWRRQGWLLRRSLLWRRRGRRLNKKRKQKSETMGSVFGGRYFGYGIMEISENTNIFPSSPDSRVHPSNTFNGPITLRDRPIPDSHAYASHPSASFLRKCSPFTSSAVPSSVTAVRQFSLHKTR